MHGRPMITGRPCPKAKPSALIDAGDEFDRDGGCITMRYGCPNGHTDGIEQGCQLTVWLPVNPDTGETDTDTLDGRERPMIGATVITTVQLVAKTSIISPK
jgi:hypothetical protein